MKRLVLSLLLFTLFISSASALVKEVVYNQSEKYPQFRIWNDAETILLAKLKLIENTERCSNNCQAVILLDLNTSWTLPESPNTNFQFNFWNNARTYLKNNDITNLTLKVSGSNTSNGTTFYPNYVNIPWGNTISPGVKYIKITGEKSSSDSVEWIPHFMGLELYEWAVWNSTDFGRNNTDYFTFNETIGTYRNFFNGSLNMTNGSASRPTPGYTKPGGKKDNFMQCGTNVTQTAEYTAYSTDYTMGAWVYPNLTGAATQVMFGRGKFGVDYIIEVYAANTTGGVTFSYKTATIEYKSNATMVQNSWNLIVLSCNATRVKLVVNNVTAYYNTTVGSCMAVDKTTAIGACNRFNNASASFVGGIDELFYYSRALNDTDIYKIYNNGDGFFAGDDEDATVPTSPLIQNTLLSPVDNYFTNSTSVTLTANANPAYINITNVTFYWQYKSTPATWGVLYTNTTAQTTNFSVNISYNYPSWPANAQYEWNARSCGTNGTFTNCSWASSNYTFTVDTTTPRVQFASPSNGSAQNTISNTSTFTFNYTLTESYPNTCWYYNTTANVTLANCGANFSIPLGFGYNKVILYINDSAGNMNQTDVTVFVNRIMPYVNYKLSVIEGNQHSIYWNVTADLISTINGTLNYNSTYYPLSIFSNNGTYAQIYTNLSVPSARGKIYFNISYAINGQSNNSDTYEQNISQLIFGLCNATNNVVFGNYSLKNITAPYDPVFGTFSATWWYVSSGNLSYMKNLSIVNVSGASSYAVCLQPTTETFYIMSSIVYGATGYHTNTYYDINTTWTSNPTNVSLYLLSSGLGTSTIHTVKTNSQAALQGYYVKIYVYDAGTNTYKLFAVLKTNNDGQDTSYLNWYDTFYKYIIADVNGVSVYSTDNTKVFASPKTFIITDTSADVYGKFYGVVSNVYWYNNSRNVSAVFNDPNGNITGGCLRVIRMNNARSEILVTTCINATSGNINYTIPSGLNGTYWGVFYATGSIGWIDSMVHFGILDYTTDIYTQIGNLDGSFFALIIVGTAAFIGIFFGAGVSIIFAMFGLIASFLLGFVSANDTDFLAAVLGLGAVGGYLVYKLRT